jgi:hypothetical protein
MQRRSADVEELLRGVHGFQAYYAVRAGDALTTVTVCQDQAGTEESTRRAADWVKRNVTGATIGAPQVAQGEVFIGFVS